MARIREILLVEDDVIAQLTFRQILKGMGKHRLHLAESADQALKVVNEQSVDAIFMDIMIKGDLDGIETAKRILTIRRIPVIFLTGSNDRFTAERARAVPNFGFLLKPYDRAQIGESLTKVFAPSKRGPSHVNGEDSGQFLAAIFETAQVGMCVTDSSGRFVKVNQSYCETYNYAESELIGNHFSMLLPEADRDFSRKLHVDFLEKGGNRDLGEWRVRDKHGQLKDVFVTSGRVITPHGKRYKVTTVTDITENKRYLHQLEESLREKENLVREVHHRVKNNLNIISGLLYLQSEKLGIKQATKELFADSINRIKALAFIHEKLYKRDNLAVINLSSYIEVLSDSLLTSLCEPGQIPELRLSLQRVETDIDRAICCGLVLNEAISNSIKHAFDQPALGKIVLSLTQENGHIALEVADNGRGFKNNGSTIGLGLELIKSLSHQIGGELELCGTSGVRMKLSFSSE